MKPRVPYGSNLAAHWGLLYKRFGKERVTIYALDDASPPGVFGPTARPLFGYDFTGRSLYDRPGFITDPDLSARQPFSRPVVVPVRPHFGVMGVAPAVSGRLSSVPPGVFGGNVDNWRVGPGATMRYPVFVDGANLYVGDPHFAQGDGEVCGTAIEASLTARIQISIERGAPVTAPQLETDTHWFTHGFGDDLDEAMTMAVEQMLALLQDRFSLAGDDAYSLASVAVDVGVTQVVDGRLGCHASIAKSISALPRLRRQPRIRLPDSGPRQVRPCGGPQNEPTGQPLRASMMISLARAALPHWLFSVDLPGSSAL